MGMGSSVIEVRVVLQARLRRTQNRLLRFTRCLAPGACPLRGEVGLAGANNAGDLRA